MLAFILALKLVRTLFVEWFKFILIGFLFLILPMILIGLLAAGLGI